MSDSFRGLSVSCLYQDAEAGGSLQFEAKLVYKETCLRKQRENECK